MSLGGGTYRYFDTTLAPNGTDSEDLHGWAQIYSASVTYYAPERWFLRLLVNRIVAGGDVDTQTAVLGVGYRLWKQSEDEHGTPASGGAPPATAHEVVIFGGDS